MQTHRQRIFNHSPDGFSWGYRGSGPAQLALALMLDFFDADHHKAQRYHQDFKDAKVVYWPSEAPWKITTAEIQAVVDEIDAKRMEIANQMRSQNS